MIETTDIITTLEELQLNNWQPLQTMVYDGWILRFADGYSKRANSIQPLYPSTSDLDKKIAECEQMYASKQLRTAFKMTPSVFPRNLDKVLDQKGYVIEDRASVQILDLTNIKNPSFPNVTIDETLLDSFDDYCKLSGIPDSQKATVKRMFSNIRTKKALLSLTINNTAVAYGLGVIDREYLGLWGIVTDRKHRKQGLGEQLLLNLLQWGKKNGAKSSFLVVVANNQPALNLYSKIGFKEKYQQWYRVKEQQTYKSAVTP
ncbi:GNAT family N-acetyltransferase [Bacillus gobiensis]|uniref:GNAT family N-acetyltransferase n=1 Tax=Bacillus gobiensis TaxID=1441095 RepID=UPI003D2375BC